MTNFGIYGKSKVAIPRKSTTLINGRSESGKTTIMEFFVFALYDEVDEPEKKGTKRCWGWVVDGNFVVYRQKDPKLVKVWVNNIPPDATGDLEIPAMSGDEYINTAAQDMINRRFGTFHVFMATSYLRQKEFSPLLTGTDAQKLDIIKEVTSRESEFDNVRTPIKEKLKILQADTISTQAQFRQSLSAAQTFDMQHPDVIKAQSIVVEDSAVTMDRVRALRQNLADLNNTYMITLQHESDLKQLDGMINLVSNQIQDCDKKLESYKDRNFDDEAYKIELELSTLQTESSDSKNRILVDLYKQWEVSKERIQQALNKNTQSITSIILTLNKYKDDVFGGKTLSIDNLSIADVEEWTKTVESYIAKYNQYNKAKQEYLQKLSNSGFGNVDGLKAALVQERGFLEAAKKVLDETKNEIDNHRKKQKWDCPQCGTSLIMGEGGKTLQKSEPIEETPPVTAAPITTNPILAPPISAIAPGKSSLFRPTPTPFPTPTGTPMPISPITTHISHVRPQSSHHDVQPCKYSHDDLVKAGTEVARLSNLVSVMETRVSDIQKAAEELADLKKSLNIDPEIGDDLKSATYITSLSIYAKAYLASKADYEHHMSIQPQKIDESDDKKNNGTRIDELRTLKMKIQNDKDYCGSFRLMADNYRNQHTGLVEKRAQLQNQSFRSSQSIIEEMRNNQLNIDGLLHLNSSSELIAQRHIIQKTLEEQSENAKVAQSRFDACQRLLTKAIEAERIALDSAVADLNEILARILKPMFTLKPMSVELQTTKELQNGKGVSQRFDMVIFHDGNKYKSYKKLSGGAKDRLSIAITMALNIKFGGNILFLDETLSSLDAEVKGTVISLLKEFSSEGRVVLAASHEETEGFYDLVIRLN